MPSTNVATVRSALNYAAQHVMSVTGMSKHPHICAGMPTRIMYRIIDTRHASDGVPMVQVSTREWMPMALLSDIRPNRI